MITLAVDSCTRTASCAVVIDGRVISSGYIDNGNTHSVKLLPLIEKCLKDAEITPEQIDFYVATRGPGSYTGQRIGLATIKAMAAAHGKVCAGVSSLLTMAHNMPFFDGIIAPIIDARSARVYNGLYRWNGTILDVLQTDRVITIEALLDELKDKKVIFMGDGIFSYTDKLKNQLIASPHLSQINASAAAFAWTETISPDQLLPLYLQKTQAEREYKE